MLLGMLALGVVAYAGATACDSTAKITPQELLFKDLRVVSAYPATLAAGTTDQWVRACGDAEATGVMVNVALVSTQRNAGDDNDSDTSMRPGDVVNLRVVDGPQADDIQVAPGTVELDLDCLEELPDSNLSTCAGSSAGAGVPLNVPSVSYESYADITQDASLKDQRDQARTTSHNVLLLIDQSGSMSGLVNLANCEGGKCGEDGCSCKEDDPGVVNQNVGSQKFINYASDYYNARITAARSFIENLNSRDRLAVLAFGEDISGEDMIVGCNDTFGDVDKDLERCFKSDRDLVLTGSAGDIADPLSSLPSGTGRSNMWTAVDKAYKFFQGESAKRPRETYHVVVLTDGPDTCAVSDDFGGCQQPCSVTTHQAVLDMIDQDLADKDGARIRIHFVQFESKGHTGRDPRQVDVACVTGGHYQFVNTVGGFSSAQTGPFIEALEAALFNIRYSLMGNWQFSGNVPVWTNSTTAPGTLFALSGQFTITDSSFLQPEFDKQSFDVGKGAGAKDATEWDRRPTLLKPCVNSQECGATPDFNDGGCSIVCSSDTRLCPNGSTGLSKVNGASCAINDSQGGICCSDGSGTSTPVCEAGACAACTEL